MFWERLRASAKALVFGCCIIGFAGCGGSHSSPPTTVYVYVACGAHLAQFVVGPGGQLSPLIPPTVASTNPVAIATTRDGRFAYAANFTSNNVAQFTIGPTGTLTPMGPPTVTAGTHPAAVVATPDGKSVYVLNKGSNTISEFSIGAGGSLTPRTIPTISVASDGDSLAVTPDSQFLYATSYGSGKVSAYAIGLDGQLTALAVPTYDVSSPTGPAISPDGMFLYVPQATSGVAQFSIGLDGSLTPLVPPTVSTPNAGDDTIAITPSGLYAYVGMFNGGLPGSPVAQFSVGGNGLLSPLIPDTVPVGNAPIHAAVDPKGEFLYVANSNDGTISQFVIEGNGTLAALATPTVSSPGALQIAFAQK
jgi:6-phosphogluconolactonase